MNPSVLAYAVWQLLFNRLVWQQTSDAIFDHCAQYIEKNQPTPQELDPSNYENNEYFIDAVATMPPTDEEVAPVAYGLYEEALHYWRSNVELQQWPFQDNPGENWNEAVSIVWRGRRE